MLRFAKYSAWVSVLLMVNEYGVHSKQVPQIVIPTEKQKWLQAESNCNNRGPACRLAVGEGEGSIHWESLNIADNERYWVGGKKQRDLHWKESGRLFFEDVGCHHVSTILGDYRTVTSNNPVQCFQTCNTQSVGLQEAKCFCLHRNTSMSKANGKFCNVKCKDQANRCGGAEKISVFKFPSRTALNKTGASDIFYWRVERHWFLITNTASGRIGRFCVSATEKYQVPESSLCPPGSKDLAFEGNDMDELFQEVSGMKKAFDSYLMPLSNIQGTLWLNDLPVASVANASDNNPGGCVAVSRIQGNITLYLQNCRTDLYSICTCFKDIEDPLTGPVASSTSTGMPTSTELTLTDCADLEVTRGPANSQRIWSCTTEPGQAVGSKRGVKSENPPGNTTAIIAVAAGVGAGLIVAVALIIAIRIRRGSRNSIIQRDKYGRVHYPI